MKSPDELRNYIAKGRRITRDADLLAALDALEEFLSKPTEPHHDKNDKSAEAIGLRRREYQRKYMRDYRAGKLRGGKRCGPTRRVTSA